MRIVPVIGRLPRLAVLLAALLLAAACGDDADPGGRPSTGAEPPSPVARIVVTTNILGDVVSNIAGRQAEIEVIMPPGADPHDFAPSARQIAAMREADALVANGAGFEEGLVATIDAADEDGVAVFEATSALDLIEIGAGGHDHDDDHDDGGHGDAGRGDPHFFTDPARMAQVVEHLSAFLAEHVEGIDTAALAGDTDAYVARLQRLDAEIDEILAAVPPARRVLITNHDVFGYFADRYGFEVLGVVLPGGSTLAEPSAGDVAALARTIEREGVPAIFADESARNRLVDALAAEVGHDVEVVPLFTESLGPSGSDGATYIDMVRANAERIAAALAA